MTTTTTTTPTDKKDWDVTTVLIALCLTLTIIGALNWGTTAYGYNLVELVAGKDTSLFTKKLKLKCEK
jgi:hypothetical protein